LFLLSGPKIGWATRCPDKREIRHGGADHMSAPCAEFNVYRGKNVGIQPRKL